MKFALRKYLVVPVVAGIFSSAVLAGVSLPVRAYAQSTDTYLAVSTLVAFTNDSRAANGVAPLSEDPLLDKAAQKKANDMAAKGYFAHRSPNGSSPWHWISLVGFHYTHAAENLAIDFTDPADLTDAWMASPTHRANIVRATYTKIGFGVAKGVYRGQPTTFIVQLLATEKST